MASSSSTAPPRRSRFDASKNANKTASPSSPTDEQCRLAADYSRYFEAFKTAVPTQTAKLTLDNQATQTWEYYRLGGEEDLSLNLDPVVFLPPESASCDVFFLQIDALAAKGYKCISCQHPPIWTIEEFVAGFGLFLDHIQARRCHLFGAGLGGFLAQTYAASCPRRVASLLLCNTFCETPYSGVGMGAGMVIGMLPSATLRSIVLKNHISALVHEEDESSTREDPHLGPLIRKRNYHRRMVKEVEAWVEGNLTHLSPELLQSKVTLAYAASTLPEVKMSDYRVLIIECLDLKDLNEQAAQGSAQLKARHPYAKLADQKTGGSYPFLCAPMETTIFLEVHLRNCDYFPQFDSPGPKVKRAPDDLVSGAEVFVPDMPGGGPLAMSPAEVEAPATPPSISKIESSMLESVPENERRHR
ncbi:unnamed protein product [Amoebophrya sp. A120]|nr:unnamed protein product [Amoebophrya sp. A120]|eukprot:GSA120T00011598001.1